ncbi:ribosomal protein L1-like protein, partial [Gorgonomyces haynaldii]
MQRSAVKIFRRGYDRKYYQHLKKEAKRKQNQEDVPFISSVELLRSYALGEPKQVSAILQLDTEKKLRAQVVLPHQLMKQNSKILLFCSPKEEQIGKDLGIDYVGGAELIEQVKNGEIEFHQCLATKSIFPQVVKIAKILGPKGLMPSPSKGTVGENIPEMLKLVAASTNIETDDKGIVQLPIGTIEWDANKIKDNMQAVLKAVLALKPSKAQDVKFVPTFALGLQDSVALKLPLKVWVKEDAQQ